ncbi:TetR family transcriptional regulator [Nocardioides sp. NPDC006303]|uniref:TetR/AcrR family transcriptional regulator n=1 Tax=Nocardioides sp. NPDC006303 TaxID=3156747 RepID=UPI0033B12B3E
MGLRDTKKERTRRRLVEIAYELFTEQGYDETTTNQIAAAAEVSPATFFNYFPTKDSLVFTDGPAIAEVGVRAVRDRSPGEPPAECLSRALRAMIDAAAGTTREPGTSLEATRLALVTAVPSLRATFVGRALTTQHALAEALSTSYADSLDEETAHAMVGAAFGAALAVGMATSAAGRPTADRLLRAAAKATAGFTA